MDDPVVRRCRRYLEWDFRNLHIHWVLCTCILELLLRCISIILQSFRFIAKKNVRTTYDYLLTLLHHQFQSQLGLLRVYRNKVFHACAVVIRDQDFRYIISSTSCSLQVFHMTCIMIHTHIELSCYVGRSRAGSSLYTALLYLIVLCADMLFLH